MKVSTIRNYLSWIVAIGLCCSIAACSKKSDQPQGTPAQTDKPVIYTVNYPLAYFAERIGDNHVEVRFPAPDEDPAYWKPDAETLEQYQQADLILTNGAGYAKWMETVSLPTSKCLNTSVAFQDRYIELEEALTHSHGPTGQHAHGGLAFTTWLDFALAAEQAQAIQNGLIKLSLDNEAEFKANFAALEKDLMELDNRMKTIAEKIKDTPLVVSHPVYQYWTKAYGLNTRSVHWEPDQMPEHEQWVEFRELLESHPAKWMIWEGKPDSETVELLMKENNVQSVIFDPCGAKAFDQDFLRSMQANIKNLEQIR